MKTGCVWKNQDSATLKACRKNLKNAYSAIFLLKKQKAPREKLAKCFNVDNI